VDNYCGWFVKSVNAARPDPREPSAATVHRLRSPES
jgi:hypothetical protein